MAVQTNQHRASSQGRRPVVLLAPWASFHIMIGEKEDDSIVQAMGKGGPTWGTFSDSSTTASGFASGMPLDVDAASAASVTSGPLIHAGASAGAGTGGGSGADASSGAAVGRSASYRGPQRCDIVLFEQPAQRRVVTILLMLRVL